MALDPKEMEGDVGRTYGFIDGNSVRTFTTEETPFQCVNGPWMVRGFYVTRHSGRIRCTMDLEGLYELPVGCLSDEVRDYVHTLLKGIRKGLGILWPIQSPPYDTDALRRIGIVSDVEAALHATRQEQNGPHAMGFSCTITVDDPEKPDVET